jgi:hypothetical protein
MSVSFKGGRRGAGSYGIACGRLVFEWKRNWQSRLCYYILRASRSVLAGATIDMLDSVCKVSREKYHTWRCDNGANESSEQESVGFEEVHDEVVLGMTMLKEYRKNDRLL